MAGDKVFTPLWSPGQQNHFALTGIMNLDGDGRNQLSVVRGLITRMAAWSIAGWTNRATSRARSRPTPATS